MRPGAETGGFGVELSGVRCTAADVRGRRAAGRLRCATIHHHEWTTPLCRLRRDATVCGRRRHCRPAGPERPAHRGHDRAGRPDRGHHRHGLRRDQPRQQADADRAGEPDRRAAVLEVHRGGCTPGTPVAISSAADRGHPLASLSDLPAGEYWMQPFVNVYTRFPRADGKTVWLHMDQWEGQNWKRSPGNVYGEPVQVQFDPQSRRPIRLVADKVIPPIAPPADTAQVKRIKIESQILTKWWGHPIYPRRDGAAAEGLRPASRRPLPGELRAGALLAARAGRLRQRRRIRHASGWPTTRRASSTSRCSTRRRTTTTRTA